MDDIRAIIRRAGVRLGISDFLTRLHVVLLGAASIVLLLILAGKATPMVRESVSPSLVGGAVVLAACGAAWLWWINRRPEPVHVAILVDERLELREKLSTAMMLRGRDDGFAQAAVDDAVNVARSPQTHERVKRAFAVHMPNRWWISPLILIAAVVCSLTLQDGDLFAREREQMTDEQRQELLAMEEQIEQAKIEVAEQLNKDVSEIEELLEEAAEGNNQPENPNHEQAKLQQFKKLTAMREELEKAAMSPENAAMEAMLNKLAQLNKSDDGQTGEIAQAMAKGDFDAARKALDKLMQQAGQKGLSQADQRALENLAKQLEQLAANNQALANALKQAGLNPDLAADPKAAQQAIQNAQNLTQDQKQQLQQMAQAMMQANSMCQNMAQACQGLQGGNMAAGQNLGDQLSQMEMAAATMQSLNQQMDKLGGMCNKAGQGQGNGESGGLSQAMAQQMQWMQRNGMGPGPGMGNRPGQGAGGFGTRLPTAAKEKNENATSKTMEGPIIGEQVVDGFAIIRGDSEFVLREAVKTASERAQESLEQNITPPDYSPTVQHYYGEVKAKAERREAAESSTSAETAASEGEAQATESTESETESDGG
ncbi:MAG: hypothetical protein D8M59_00025 [Planctomycetes bacterium]|nr:hypothetical protein [Planctomycetota bacterium]NOG56081.1 hypothetical protein [Planctomycetota bacterium]